MTLKELKELINGLGPGYNDHEIIVATGWGGFSKGHTVSANSKYRDEDVIHVYSSETPTSDDFLPCVVLWS